MGWRLAGSLEKLREQLNREWPGRSTISDGSIGDADHQTRTSDHNPWVPPPNGGVVTAIDVTHDPGSGADMRKLAGALRRSQDPRIKYVIFDWQMFSSYATSSTPAWTWRPYSGVNGHVSHMHLSIQPTGYDDPRPWDITGRKDWFTMASQEDLEKIVRKVVKEEVAEARKLLAVGKSQKNYNPDNINLAAIIRPKE